MLILTDEKNDPIKIFSVYNALTLCTCNSEQLPYILDVSARAHSIISQCCVTLRYFGWVY